MLQAFLVSLPGIFYGALLLRGSSLWPGVVIHWISNAAVNVKLIGDAAYEETPVMWLGFARFAAPLAAAGLTMLRSVPPRSRPGAGVGVVAAHRPLTQHT